MGYKEYFYVIVIGLEQVVYFRGVKRLSGVFLDLIKQLDLEDDYAVLGYLEGYRIEIGQYSVFFFSGSRYSSLGEILFDTRGFFFGFLGDSLGIRK